MVVYEQIENDERLTRQMKDVAMFLLDHAGPDGLVDLTRDEIAEAMSTHPSRVSQIRSALVAAGIVLVTERFSVPGYHGSRNPIRISEQYMSYKSFGDPVDVGGAPPHHQSTTIN